MQWNTEFFAAIRDRSTTIRDVHLAHPLTDQHAKDTAPPAKLVVKPLALFLVPLDSDARQSGGISHRERKCQAPSSMRSEQVQVARKNIDVVLELGERDRR